MSENIGFFKARTDFFNLDVVNSGAENNAVGVAHRNAGYSVILAAERYRVINKSVGSDGACNGIVKIRLTHVGANRADLAVADIKVNALNTACSFNRYRVAVYISLVINIFCKASHTVSAHLGSCAIRIVEIPTYVACC